jgi:pimeloyl-ACP methyl ester carboxylesterase
MSARQPATYEASIPRTTLHRIVADGVQIFYRAAGPVDAPVILLLHGFPTSSHMFRELIPRLATRYRVIAPDLPGFGFTSVLEERKYIYSFDSLATTMLAFVNALGLERYAIYVFDYGAPVGFRLAVARPDSITAIISQNGNAYDEGLSHAWDDIRRYWDDPSEQNREALQQGMLTFDAIRAQYTTGVLDPESIAPESYILDWALLQRPGNREVQLDFLFNYSSNIALYPVFQKYFREDNPPLLAIWGKNDPFFKPAGAEAFLNDNPNAEVILLNTGHFALETHVDEIASSILRFLNPVRS